MYGSSVAAPATRMCLGTIDVVEHPNLGAAATFNRLIRESRDDIVVVLRAGTRVAPGCFDALLDALRRHPTCALAGPHGGLRAPDGDIVHASRVAARRYGRICVALEPPTYLGDACVVAPRRAIDMIGFADETTPCWTAEYAARAARVGFNTYSVRGAYADGVEPIAPAPPETPLPARPIARHTETIATPAVWPLVSCIMPTHDRRAFVTRALRCFEQQDYPALELIVVDDGVDSVADLASTVPNARYWRLPEKQPIGAKRNFACEVAKGTFIIHWDDDDWYPPSRVRRQITPLLDGTRWISGTSLAYYYDEAADRAFCYRGRATPCAWMAGLAYPKSLWARRPFEPIQIGEDVRFLKNIPASALADLRDPALYVASIHSANSARKVTAGVYWSPEPTATIRALVEASGR